MTAQHTPTREEDAVLYTYRDDFHYLCLRCAPHPCRPTTKYVRADVYDDLVAALKDMTRIATAASIGVTGNQPRIEKARTALAKAGAA